MNRVRSAALSFGGTCAAMADMEEADEYDYETVETRPDVDEYYWRKSK
jgi:hypothetical protein